MPWPPTPTAAYYIQKNGTGAPTTLVWGTDGVYASVIVKSMRSSQMAEEIKIENGTGLTAVEILLVDGVEIEVTVVDDNSITFPLVGGTVTLFSGVTNAGLLVGPGSFSNNSKVSMVMQVVNNNTSNARKQEGERTLTCKKYSLIGPT